MIKNTRKFEPKVNVTPKQIAERCLIIQAGWSRRTERKRRGMEDPSLWTMAIIDDSGLEQIEAAMGYAFESY